MDNRPVDLIGRAEAARILGVTPRHVARLPLEPYMQLPTERGAMLYRREDVLELAEQRKAAA